MIKFSIEAIEDSDFHMLRQNLLWSWVLDKFKYNEVFSRSDLVRKCKLIKGSERTRTDIFSQYLRYWVATKRDELYKIKRDAYHLIDPNDPVKMKLNLRPKVRNT